MSNDDIDIKHLAMLARIEVSDEEAAAFHKDFAGILSYVDRVSAVEVDAAGDRGSVTNVLRDDVEPYEAGQFTKEILDNAPDVDDGYIKVPKIL